MSSDLIVEENEELRAFIAGFLNSFHGALIAVDKQWRIVFLNDSAEELFDISKKSLIGVSLEKLYPKYLGKILSPEEINKILKSTGKTVSKYTSHLHKWFRISANESNSYIFIRLEDVTAEMLINRLLRLNEYSVSIAKDMIFWVKPGGHVIYSNIALQVKLGYTNQEIAKMKMFNIDPSLIPKNWSELVGILKSEMSRTSETTFCAADSHMIPVEVTWNYLEYGGEEYIMGFARDITARKKVEKELIESKTEAELYVDLMGHDINNMNQVALGFLELALDSIRTEGKLDSTHIEMLEKPREMLLSSSKLIDNVRKIQREKAGRYETRAMDIGKILAEVKDQSMNVSGREIKIELVQNGKCQVAANELIKDVFVNLIGNSIKHSNGPLWIKIMMLQAEEDGKSYCRVAVEDDGPGISDDMKQKLLNRLSPNSARARGKGLGLYLIKQLVDDFNGRFWMEDRVPGNYSKGARFIVMLPVIDE